MTHYSDIVGKVVGGERKDFLTEDDLPTGLFEIDVNGGLMPVTDVESDNHYELDGNDDIMPLAA